MFGTLNCHEILSKERIDAHQAWFVRDPDCRDAEPEGSGHRDELKVVK